MVGERGHAGVSRNVWDSLSLAENPTKGAEEEQKVSPLSMVAENHVTKIKLFKGGIKRQNPHSRVALSILDS